MIEKLEVNRIEAMRVAKAALLTQNKASSPAFSLPLSPTALSFFLRNPIY